MRVKSSTLGPANSSFPEGFVPHHSFDLLLAAANGSLQEENLNGDWIDDGISTYLLVSAQMLQCCDNEKGLPADFAASIARAVEAPKD